MKTSDDRLVAEAWAARERAYACYSGFKVGAALEASIGTIFGGCNIENISFGLTICAERVALFNAIQNGAIEFKQLVIVSDSQDPIVPCGACRQVLAEFAPDLKIYSSTLSGLKARYSLGELLPHPKRGILEKFHVE